ncbi:MAG: hypothetical protein K2N63_10335 [Lachnospiraceae bacterium]|nr:hypothetical protein [Lachnospiraceae bacterium]
MWTKEMRKKLGKAANAIIFTAGLIYIFLSLTRLMQYKAAVTRMEPFFETEEPIDVMLFGTSHVTDGILPLELWGNYGISSYNFGNNAARIPLTYWKIENVFDYQVPRLVVVDCSYLSSNNKTSTVLQQSHNVLDSFPLTKTKRAAIEDLMDSEEDNKLEFFWPFSIYHNRWDELTKKDFIVDYNNELGAEPKYLVATPANYQKIGADEKLQTETIAMEYIGKLISSCRERGVEVLLTYLPCPANSTRQKEANTAYDLAERYGVNYINFLDLPDVVNFMTDCNDADSHLNASGAKKVTDYLGTYIGEHYNIPDRRTQAAFDFLNEAYTAYLVRKMQAFGSQKLLSSYLMLLADQDITSQVYVREDSAILRDERMLALLENIRQYGADSEVKILSAEEFAACNMESPSADIRLEVFGADSKELADLTWFTVTSEQPLTIKRAK